jgi:hypothetical protein
MPYTIETGEPSRPYNTLEWTNIGGSRHTQNTGQTTNMETTHRNSESEMQQETAAFETSGGNPRRGADQSTLLRVHKMLVLSVVEFGSVDYGSAMKKQLKKLDPIHNKGLHIAVGAFCINRTQNLLIEAGESTLQQRVKTANMTVKITTKPEGPETIMEVNIVTTMPALPQGIEHTQNKSRVRRNPKRKLPGLHPNMHGRIKNEGESRVRSSHPR